MLIERSNTCGNSRKNQFTEDFTIHLFKVDKEYLKEKLNRDFQMTIIGKNTISDMNDLTFNNIFREEIKKIKIDTSITHGKLGASFGMLEANSNDFNFAISYEFASATKLVIKEAKIFILEVNK